MEPTTKPKRPARLINGAEYEVCPSGVLLGKGGASSHGWHSISAYMQCPKEYQYKHVRKISQPMTGTPDHFAVGTALHAGRARWFAEGYDASEATWNRIREDIRLAFLDHKLPVNLKAERQGLRLVAAYIDWYSKLPKPKPIAMEYLLGPQDIYGQPLSGRLDDVSSYPEIGGLAIGEVKTTSGKISETVKQYECHGQPILQQLLWARSPFGAAMWGPVKGTILDVIRKTSEDGTPEFARHVLRFNDELVADASIDIGATAAEARRLTWNSPARRNLTACTRPGSFGRMNCDYKELCMHGDEAAGGYVDETGASLLGWRPSGDKSVLPWS